MSQINNPFIIKGAIPSHYFCDREEEIENFIPEEYWTIFAEFKDGKSKKGFQAKLVGKENKKIEIREKIIVQKMDKEKIQIKNNLSFVYI